MIHAQHPATGRTGTFSNRAWELLPPRKDGWQQIAAQMPGEVADALKSKPAGNPRKAHKHENPKQAV